MKGERKKLYLIILNIIRKGDIHGYAIAEKLEKTYGIKKPGSSVIYPLLAKLREDGFIDVVREGKRDKKIYRITSKGLKFLKERKEEIKEAERVLRAAGKFYRMGGDELLEALHEFVKSMDSLDEGQVKKIERLLKETAIKIKLALLRGEMNE